MADSEEKSFDQKLAERRRLNELSDKNPSDLAHDELIELLEDQFTGIPIPPCPVCGRDLTVASAGGGHATKYACSTNEADPDRPGFLRNRTDYKSYGMDWLEHYARSEFVHHKPGNPWVLELIKRVKWN